MALSYVNYTAGGSDTDYTITFPYLSEDYVTVYLDGVLKTITTDYTFFNATTIRFNSTVGAGVLVLLKRATLDTSRVVDFQDAGNLTEADLDNSADQVFHLQQEILDSVDDNSMQLNSSNEWDAESHKIINLSDPTLAQDAVTKNWAETEMTSSLAAALAAQAAAEVAQTAAELAETNAETAETGAAADLVLTNADVVSTNADVVTTTADAVTTTADAATTTADAVTTTADAATTTQDAIDTAADVVSTNADVVSTNADVVLTAADVVLCDAAYDAFDDRYLGAKASDPALDNDGNALLTGALYYKTASVVGMYVYSGSAWGIVPGLSNLVEDLTPQLGGDLDVNGNDIVSVSNGDINLAPHGTGEVTVAGEKVIAPDELSYPYMIASGEGTLTGVSDSVTLLTYTAHLSTPGTWRGLCLSFNVALWGISGAPTAAYDDETSLSSKRTLEHDYDASITAWQEFTSTQTPLYGPSSAIISSVKSTTSGTNDETMTITVEHGANAVAVDADTVTGYRVQIFVVSGVRN